MYVIFQSGGKQHRVSEGEIICLEKLKFEKGQIVEFNNVLMSVNNGDIKIGNPFILNSSIKGEIISHVRNKKIKIIKFHRRKHYRKQQGHRQWHTNVKITSINI